MVCSILVLIVPVLLSSWPAPAPGTSSLALQASRQCRKVKLYSCVNSPSASYTSYISNKHGILSEQDKNLIYEFSRLLGNLFHVSHFLHPLPSTTWYPLLSTQSISGMIVVDCLSIAYYDHRDAKAGVTTRQIRGEGGFRGKYFRQAFNFCLLSLLWKEWNFW